MEKYTSRLTAPSLTDKNFINTEFGGKNKCIAINSKTGYVLPNCTGYCFGRWLELLKKTPNLSVNQAEVWYTHKDDYERGNKPKLGSIICWAKGDPKNYRDGSGHVAIVEEIKDNGNILLSMSGYNSNKMFWLQDLKPPYKYGSGYTLQGFIYPPIEFYADYTYQGEFPKLPARGYFLKGDKGAEVGKLQKFLNWSINAGLVVDNSYGSLTTKAVKNFQKTVKIKTDGSYGRETDKKAREFKKYAL